MCIRDSNKCQWRNRQQYSLIYRLLSKYRSDAEEPLVRKAGDCTLDVNGISQWWENQGDNNVHLFTVDLYDPSIPIDH